MKKIIILRIFIIALLIADMAVIFSFSAEKASQSDETSSSVIERIVKIIYKDFDSWETQAKYEKVQSYQHLVRKLAHMTEYASLGVLSCALALTFGMKIKNLLFAFLFCVLYSGSDEFHQLFVPGRSGQITDVLIDSGGALIGIAGFSLLVFVIVKIKEKGIGENKNGF